MLTLYSGVLLMNEGLGETFQPGIQGVRDPASAIVAVVKKKISMMRQEGGVILPGNEP